MTAKRVLSAVHTLAEALHIDAEGDDIEQAAA